MHEFSCLLEAVEVVMFFFVILIGDDCFFSSDYLIKFSLHFIIYFHSPHFISVTTTVLDKLLAAC